MMEFTHQATIDAPAAKVFGLITDLAAYPSWNPFIIKAEGEMQVGGVIRGKSVLGKITTSYRHRIFELLPDKSLCWKDFGFMSLLVCGHRHRYVEEQDGKTLYTCELKLTGPLSGMVNLFLGEGLRNGIIAEAEAMANTLR